MRQYPQFDGLRAIAVALVAYHHWVYDHKVGAWYAFHLGPFGVQIFFVLSGFLITGILRENAKSGDAGHLFRAFYARRALRIFPIYFLTIGLLSAFAIPPFPELFWWNALYAGNIYIFVHQAWMGLASHFWTLAMEEQFYLIWPAVIVVFASGFRYVALASIAIGAVVFIAMKWFAPAVDFVFMLPIVGMDALAIGAVLSTKDEFARKVTLACWPFAVFWCVGQATGFIETGLINHYGGIAASVVLVHGALTGWKGPLGWLLNRSWMQGIGKISYGIYVYHAFVAAIVARIMNVPFPGNMALQTIASAALTLLVAYVSWKLIEAPINGLKRYFPYQPRQKNVGEGDRIGD
jgi:peptidoglycan/LPS O-acetylase OafA/YrhL